MRLIGKAKIEFDIGRRIIAFIFIYKKKTKCPIPFVLDIIIFILSTTPNYFFTGSFSNRWSSISA